MGHTEFAVMDPGRDRPGIDRMLSLAFGGTMSGVSDWIGASLAENFRVLREGGRAVSTMTLVPMGQWWGGRSVPMLGVAGVAVAPEDRGRGHAKRMMESFVRESAGSGGVLSGLYASTHSLYRGVGFEHAGVRMMYSVPLVRIDVAARAGGVERLTAGHGADVSGCYSAFASLFDGTLDRGPYIWARVRKFREEEYEGFGVRGPTGSLEGYLYVSLKRLDSGKLNLSLSDLAFLNAAAGRRLLSFVRDFGMMGEAVTFAGGPAHPAAELLGQQRHTAEIKDTWMIRVLDVARAVAARGFPRGVSGEVHLEVRDGLVERNDGRWVVRVEGGRGEAVRGGRGEIGCSINGFAAMYAGYLSPAQCAMVGLAEGDEGALNAAGGVLGAGSPWMSDHF
ncbi:MAG: GNAT family N-acetyltransferase [Phycisphaeraceae bacterium]|nr:MAG: GNAT family N-acetyltransferase [Phycisphaeraceae bacterium]